MKRSKSTPLHLAIRDPAELEKLLQEKEDELFIHQSKNSLFESADSPTGLLQCAVLAGNEESISLLLQRGADINERDECGRTALIHACTEGHASIVRLLLKLGADVSICDGEGQNCAHWAYCMEHTHIGDWLVKRYQAQLHTRDNNGKLPVDWKSTDDSLSLEREEGYSKRQEEGEVGEIDQDNAQLTAFVINGKETNFAAGTGLKATRWLHENSAGLMQEFGNKTMPKKG